MSDTNSLFGDFLDQYSFEEIDAIMDRLGRLMDNAGDVRVSDAMEYLMLIESGGEHPRHIYTATARGNAWQSLA